MANDDWAYLGEGAFNKAYKSKDGTEVLKIRFVQNKTDDPIRSVRLWNDINSHINPPARLASVEGLGDGWICPFIEGTDASDEQIADSLIDIFTRTGRIIIDATVPGNFKATPKGQVVCVDIGYALELEKRDNQYLSSKSHHRSKSDTSSDEWSKVKSIYDNDKFEYSSYPVTVRVLKALLFIKEHRPDIYDASFLKTNPEIITLCAKAYGKQKIGFTLAHLDVLTVKKATFPIPENRIQLKLQGFVEYLRTENPSLVISDDEIQDVSLSKIYTNPEDDNESLVDIEITNTDVLMCFLQYSAQQEQGQWAVEYGNQFMQHLIAPRSTTENNTLNVPYDDQGPEYFVSIDFDSDEESVDGTHEQLLALKNKIQTQLSKHFGHILPRKEAVVNLMSNYVEKAHVESALLKESTHQISSNICGWFHKKQLKLSKTLSSIDERINEAVVSHRKQNGQ
jgi:hypothetical protein